MLKDFLLFVDHDLGRWVPLVLAYIPLTVLAVPSSVLTLGGGYLFGLPVGFVADSIGATLVPTSALLIGRRTHELAQNTSKFFGVFSAPELTGRLRNLIPKIHLPQETLH